MHHNDITIPCLREAIQCLDGPTRTRAGLEMGLHLLHLANFEKFQHVNCACGHISLC